MGSDSQTSKPDPGISSPSIPSSPNPDSTNNAAETSSRATRFLENDPARTGYDPSVKWFMNYFKILTNKMTPEGMHHYREDRYRRHEKRDCEQCEKYRDWLFAHSPTVRFLREKIEALNGNLDESNVICRRCPAHIREDGTVVRQTGGFSPRHGILLCANEVRNRGHLEDTLSHEMVHAYDHVRWRMDWTGDKQLRHAACTEVRRPTHINLASRPYPERVVWLF